MNFKLPLLFLVYFLFLSCQGQTDKSVKTIDVNAFEEKLNATTKPQLLDVRTPEEFNNDHINNAVNVNWNGNDFVTKANQYDKSKPVFVYCKIGGRSAQAANKLVELGFTEVYNLEGGIMKWNASGKAKKTEENIGISNQDYNNLINSNQKVMINFSAKWCTPCQKMKPYILKLQTELKDQIKIVQLDADENKTIMSQLKLDSLPVIIVYENGKEIWKNMGYISEDDLKKHL